MQTISPDKLDHYCYTNTSRSTFQGDENTKGRTKPVVIPQWVLEFSLLADKPAVKNGGCIPSGRCTEDNL